jgi:hypothetical protein
MSDSFQEWIDAQLGCTATTPPLGPETHAGSVPHDDRALAFDVTVAAGFIDLSCFDNQTYMAPIETPRETPMETAMQITRIGTEIPKGTG